MRPYEVMLILDPGLDDDRIQSVLDRSAEIIGTAGTTGRIDKWGRRRLAYEIDHKAEGWYAVVEATAEPSAMSELDRMLSLSDDVIRHKIIRIPDVVAGRSGRPSPEAAAAAAAEPSEAGSERGDNE